MNSDKMHITDYKQSLQETGFFFFPSSHIHTSFPRCYKIHVQIAFLFIDLHCKLSTTLKPCKTQCSLFWSHSECWLLWCQIKTSSLVRAEQYIIFVFPVITNQLLLQASLLGKYRDYTESNIQTSVANQHSQVR